MVRTLNQAIRQAVEVLYEAEEVAHLHSKVAGIFLLCSGGYDSLVTSWLSDENIRCQLSQSYWGGIRYTFPKLVFINTRIGIEANRQFVHKYARLFFGKDRFHEYVTPESYEDWCMRHGFPGEAAHRWMYIRLKERALDKLVRDYTFSVDKQVLCEILNNMDQLYPPHQFFILQQIKASMRKAYESRRQLKVFITGARQEESERRSQFVTPIQIRGNQMWLSPLYDWTKEEVLKYRDHRQLMLNEVADIMERGPKDCMCGAYAGPGELEMICTFFPEEGAWIKALQDRVMAAGFPWRWEESPPAWWVQEHRKEKRSAKERKARKNGQMDLWPEEVAGELLGAPFTRDTHEDFSPLCSHCIQQHACEKPQEVSR
jgi:3'-phosphoadenosine 5'-phosphosulfate sulfotransferase (PAPS reductase)/FAD synthetase